jgi:hypothetical protein
MRTDPGPNLVKFAASTPFESDHGHNRLPSENGKVLKANVASVLKVTDEEVRAKETE